MKKQNQLRAMVFAACLAAISVVLTRFGSISVGDVYRFGFGKLPVVLSSIWLGPLWGLAVGTASDVVGALITTGCNPLFTIPAAICGGLPWLIVKFLKGKHSFPVIMVATVFTRILTSGVILTWLLAYVYGWFDPMSKFFTMLTVRMVTALVESVVEGVAIYFLVKNNSLNKLLEKNHVLLK